MSVSFVSGSQRGLNATSRRNVCSPNFTCVHRSAFFADAFRSHKSATQAARGLDLLSHKDFLSMAIGHWVHTVQSRRSCSSG